MEKYKESELIIYSKVDFSSDGEGVIYEAISRPIQERMILSRDERTALDKRFRKIVSTMK